MSASPMFKNGTQVSVWLREMGCAPDAVADPLANWAYEIGFPPNTPVSVRMRVGNPKIMPRAVVVAVRMVPQQNQLAAFNGLDEDAKREFWQALRSELNREFCEFAIEGNPMAECPQAFSVSATRFDDGLSLDSLFRTINSVLKACMDGCALFDERLGAVGPASGGEFAFRKLGMQ